MWESGKCPTKETNVRGRNKVRVRGDNCFLQGTRLEQKKATSSRMDLNVNKLCIPIENEISSK